MKTFLLFACLSVSFTALAHPCPEYLKLNSRALQALEFLQRWPRTFRLGKCRIEVFTCKGWQTTSSTVPMAEILILDEKGREAYASIQYPQEESPYFETKTLTQQKMLHYEKVDRFYEAEFGRTEALRLELVTDWKNPQELKLLELGLYSTNHQLKGPDGNTSEWFRCSRKDEL